MIDLSNFITMGQLSRDSNIPAMTLARAVKRGTLEPDGKFNGMFLFHKDRVFEIAVQFGKATQLVKEISRVSRGIEPGDIQDFDTTPEPQL